MGAILLALCLATGLSAAPAPKRPIPLVWHVETPAGAVVDSRGGDVVINPASVVKVATSLWALSRLGPEYRFETRFLAGGALDPASRTLSGNLLVQGGADPDFQVENAFRVTQALNQLGLAEVEGSLVANEFFWMGWEGGSGPREGDQQSRARRMAARLSETLDSQSWSRATRFSLGAFAKRTGTDLVSAPRVAARGPVAVAPAPLEGELLVTHRSNPLVTMLKRFNSYSNNDIERLGATLGTTADLEAFLVGRWGAEAGAPHFESLSGLGSNRMSPRRVVRLLHDLRETCLKVDLHPSDLLPVAGCDVGTLKNYPRLGKDDRRGSVVGKTGTLTTTDGGVTVLAGYLETIEGPVVFCVASQQSGGRIAAARQEIENWVLALAAARGGPRAVECGPGVGHPDDRIELSVSHPGAG